jgi:hypothetical protein
MTSGITYATRGDAQEVADSYGDAHAAPSRESRDADEREVRVDELGTFGS